MRKWWLASLGIDGRKVTGVQPLARGSTSSRALRLMLPGDERFRVFSTTPHCAATVTRGDLDGHAAAKYAVLANAAFGTQGSGFTSEKLWEIL